MLTRLAISNLATIESITIAFGEGYTVLTGETGAGKSILIDAIQFVLGAKATKHQIRSGAANTTVEAVFDLNASQEARRLLSELEIPADGELVLRRNLQASGRSRAVANDCSISQGKLEELGSNLVNVHGQHDSQLLLNPEKHIDYLDAFGQLEPLRTQVADCHRQFTQKLREKKELHKLAEQRKQRHRELMEGIDELKSARLVPGEEAALRQEHTLLANCEQLALLTGSVSEGLYEGDEAVLPRLSALVSPLKEAAAIDTSLKPLLEQMDPLRFQLEDLYRSLNSYASGLEDDPGRLDHVNTRLAQLERIKRLYGGSEEAALATLKQHERELEELNTGEVQREELNKQINQLAKRLHELATELSKKRRRAADRFDRLIVEQLRELGMTKAVFQTQIEPLENQQAGTPLYSAQGMDKVEFRLSTNPGQNLRPFSKIASGGELSRTMLALKTILAESDPTLTLIFDEVDAGISGALAERVGYKLRALGETHQVLCVTHLPQIAALSANHVLVSKEMQQHQTYTRVTPLSEKEKVQEVARLLSGIDVSDHSLASAEEMVNRGRQAQL
ncbi:MAG: DNA repair protein RecN [SAR324 cluster bacterium]|nr:DNA repair protein RecN [SAR324 cluster bacterium]